MRRRQAPPPRSIRTITGRWTWCTVTGGSGWWQTTAALIPRPISSPACASRRSMGSLVGRGGGPVERTLRHGLGGRRVHGAEWRVGDGDREHRLHLLSLLLAPGGARVGFRLPTKAGAFWILSGGSSAVIPLPIYY